MKNPNVELKTCYGYTYTLPMLYIYFNTSPNEEKTLELELESQGLDMRQSSALKVICTIIS